jgi:hypothetical protein
MLYIIYFKSLIVWIAYLSSSLEKTLFLEILKYPLLCVMGEHKNVKITLPCSPITQGRGYFNVFRNMVFF